MNAPTHLFQSQPNAARRWERATFWLFRGATYFVLGCGLAVFATIAIKGAGTVFQAKAPFINTTFFTGSPETLHVFTFEGKKYAMGDREHRAFLVAHPAATAVKSEDYAYSAGGLGHRLLRGAEGTELAVAHLALLAVILEDVERLGSVGDEGGVDEGKLAFEDGARALEEDVAKDDQTAGQDGVGR